MRLIGPFQEKRRSLDHERAFTAAFERDGIAGRTGGICLERMRRALALSHAPAGCGGAGSGRTRIGDDEARCRGARGGEAQAACRCQRHLGHEANDQRQACRAQTLLHGPKRLASARRFHEETRGRRKTQSAEALSIGAADLAGENGRPAPKDARWRRTSFKRIEAPQSEPQREAESGRPIARCRAAGASFTLHFVQSGGIETAGEAMIDLGRTERP